MELSLANRVGSAVEQAYAGSDLLEQRQELMEAWSELAIRVEMHTVARA